MSKSAYSISSCLVNPNATCPVCHEPVFYYQNDYGSKVYFDDLGPPWPKHPCTDRPQANAGRTATFAPITKRNAEEAAKLLLEIRSTDLLATGKRRKSAKGWSLYVVNSVQRDGETLRVSVESLSEHRVQADQIYFFSSENIIAEGCFVCKKAHIYSFVRSDTLEPVEVVSGQYFSSTDDKSVDGSPDSASFTEVMPLCCSDLRPNELRHFHSKNFSAKSAYQKYETIIKNFQARKIRTPNQIAHYLNEVGHRTADGSKWTPRLVFFLFCLLDQPLEVGNDPSERLKGVRSCAKLRSEGKEAQNAVSKKVNSAYSREQISAKLSRIGRIKG